MQNIVIVYTLNQRKHVQQHNRVYDRLFYLLQAIKDYGTMFLMDEAPFYQVKHFNSLHLGYGICMLSDRCL